MIHSHRTLLNMGNYFSDMRGFTLSSRVLAGVAGAGTCFIAGGLAKEKYDQFKISPTPASSLVSSAKNSVNIREFGSMSLQAKEGQERSFIMIKPDGVQRGLVGEIIKRFEQKGFKLVAIRNCQIMMSEKVCPCVVTQFTNF